MIINPSVGMSQINAPISNGPGGGMTGGQQPVPNSPFAMGHLNPAQFNRPGGTNLMGQTQAMPYGPTGVPPNQSQLMRQSMQAQLLRRLPGRVGV